jgi:hypothetical protein
LRAGGVQPRYVQKSDIAYVVLNPLEGRHAEFGE